MKHDVSLPGGKGLMLSSDACLADIQDKTEEKTAYIKDWDVAIESIRAANWGGQPETLAL